MDNEESKTLFKSYEIYRSGLTEEDKAFTSRTGNLLTFNSILIIAFIGILNKEANQNILLILSIPIFAIILSIFWMWLGSRTWLSFCYYFEQIKKKEEELNANKFIDYSKTRIDFWNCHKKGVLKFISIFGGANKLFCFYIPRLVFIFWTVFASIVIWRKVSCLFKIIDVAISISILILSFIIEFQAKAETKI